MIKITIKDWVILFAVLPTIIIGSSLAIYYAYNRIVAIDETLIDKGKTIANTLAVTTAYRMNNKEYYSLRNLLAYVQGSNSDLIKTILLFDHKNTNLINSNGSGNSSQYIASLANGELDKEYIQEYDHSYFIYFPIRLAIYKIDQKSTANKSYYGYYVIEINKTGILYEKQILLIVSLLVVFFGIFLSLHFAKRLVSILSGPVKEMNEIVLQIRQGALGVRIHEPFQGELDILRIGINNMAQAIEDYQYDLESNIEQATRDLRTALEQFEVQNVQLDLAKRKAQEANQVKSEFLANMSHELRTPLNGVIGFTRQVLKTPLSETQREFLTTIDSSANNLLSIINDILDFSKLDSGRLEIEHIPFSFRDSIDEAIILFADSAHSKNIELSLNINQNLPNSLIGDALRIKQVLINLLSNAIKFTDYGYIAVDVDYQISNDANIEISIQVIDTGIGISDKQKESLFKAFSQADKSITRLYGGTGLGLVISKRLANEMGGDINFSSQSHKGSSFFFTFKSEINQLPIDSIIEPFELEHKSVILFEPHQRSRLAMVNILKHWHMDITQVTDLRELQNQIQQRSFDFAILGQQIGSTNINDVKSLIESLSMSVGKMILAINNNSLSLKKSLINSGIHACITKPVTNKNLKHALLQTEQTFTEEKSKKLKSDPEKLPISVLAVDDNQANLKLIQTLLEQKVAAVVLASDGREAYKLCCREKFDLILMDIQMPILDGISALTKIQHDSLNIQTGIIAVTAHALPGEKEKYIRSGFDGYLAKPIDETLLDHIIFEHAPIKDHNHNNIIPAVETKHDNSEKLAHLVQHSYNGVIDWTISMQRSAHKYELAIEMFTLLINSLPETKVALQNNIKLENLPSVSSLVHKLNGASCYVGVPRLEKVVQRIETQIKQQLSLAELEPEFFELFDEIDAVLAVADDFLQLATANAK
ncbi:two-component sensor histidine kinase BarA [Thalassotalea sp. ND16A]|uniref:two-component sensor histidine kinase BarA n=1 Tax=Thalassotalea sp. ND16A TaxID=1535422 RepID=UPI00051A60A2|nr:two-component sensor histidine kinase BarA [Thalassotalea sp. ND16A]KGJ97709.1 hypothetical protein ND16A_0988 [Thalassotalea sp. ND16A]